MSGTIKPKKNYKFTIKYKIGSTDNHTKEERNISVDNIFLKLVTDALDKLVIREDSWGLQLNNDDYKWNYEKNNINKLEYDLLSLVSIYDYFDNTADEFFRQHGFENTEKNHKFIQDFEGLLVYETEFAFLVYVGYKLK